MPSNASCSTLKPVGLPRRIDGSSVSRCIVRLAYRNATAFTTIDGTTPHSAIIGPEIAGPTKRAAL